MTQIEEIPLQTIDGGNATLGDYAGKVRLIVNTASQCGLTPQYEALERIYEENRDRGFEVLGFPANDFKGQEPGTNEEIQSFCETNFGVRFPMFAKIEVTGENQHPLYKSLTEAQPAAQAKEGEDFRARLMGFGIEPNPAPGVLWNFEKFLLGRDGTVKARFAPDVAPDDPIIVSAIERELEG
jgi:glutathione peroxidase